MMVNEAIKLQKVVMLQQLMIKLRRNEVANDVRLPSSPDLFIVKSDIPADCPMNEKLIYFYFLENKDLEISLEPFMNKELDALAYRALTVYQKYFPVTDEFRDLISSYRA
jgi:hypothetical protein